MNTKTKGQITEASVALALLRKGKTILTPYGENQRYDLVIEEPSGVFKTIQCKTGRYKQGCIVFNLYSVIRDKSGKYKKTKYANTVDYYGVYCPETDKCYLIPSVDVPSIEGILRVEPRKIDNGHDTRWAKNYEI
jgi:hypothetical protein